MLVPDVIAYAADCTLAASDEVLICTV